MCQAVNKLIIFFLLLCILHLSCKNKKHESLSQLNEGKRFYETNKFDSTLFYLNNAIKLDTLNSEAYYYLSKTNYQIENYEEGFKYLNIAEKKKFNSDSIEVWKLKFLFAMENYEEYIEYCDKLINKNSSNYKMHFNKAKALFNKANDASAETKLTLLKDALKDVNISINLNNGDNVAFVLRGAIRNALEDNLGAISDFDIAINREKKDSSIISYAYRYKGLTEQDLNNLSYAESLLDSAIIFMKVHAILYIDRGNIRILLNKTDFACEDYRKALELGDNDAIDYVLKHCK